MSDCDVLRDVIQVEPPQDELDAAPLRFLSFLDARKLSGEGIFLLFQGCVIILNDAEQSRS